MKTPEQVGEELATELDRTSRMGGIIGRDLLAMEVAKAIRKYVVELGLSMPTTNGNYCKVCSRESRPLVCANCILTDHIRGRAASAIIQFGDRAQLVVDAQTLLTIFGPRPEALGSGERVIVDDVGKSHTMIEEIDLSDMLPKGS
jgi:hypothetical protein